MLRFAKFSAVFAAILVNASAYAQSTLSPPAPSPIIERTENVTVRAGQLQRLAFYPAAKRDCTRTPLSEVRLTQEPKNGKLIVRRVSINAGPNSACPGQSIPGLVVFFMAKQGYSGSDKVVYALQIAERKANVTLNIRVISGGNRTPRDTIDL